MDSFTNGYFVEMGMSEIELLVFTTRNEALKEAADIVENMLNHVYSVDLDNVLTSILALIK